MTILRQFLKAHPEHIPGHRRFAELGPGYEDALDPPALRAFLAWAWRTKGVPRQKCRLLWLTFQERFPDAFAGPPPV